MPLDAVVVEVVEDADTALLAGALFVLAVVGLGLVAAAGVRPVGEAAAALVARRHLLTGARPEPAVDQLRLEAKHGSAVSTCDNDRCGNIGRNLSTRCGGQQETKQAYAKSLAKSYAALLLKHNFGRIFPYWYVRKVQSDEQAVSLKLEFSSARGTFAGLWFSHKMRWNQPHVFQWLVTVTEQAFGRKTKAIVLVVHTASLHSRYRERGRTWRSSRSQPSKSHLRPEVQAYLTLLAPMAVSTILASSAVSSDTRSWQCLRQMLRASSQSRSCRAVARCRHE